MFIRRFPNRLKNLKCKQFSKINLRFYSNGQVRVRFAPSPTGYLHLGGLRTALYNYVFAKKHNGVFILRIEDTDQTRTIPGATDKLQEDLSWAGIEVHEGPLQGGCSGPYIQSERLQLYKDHIKLLLNTGSAYPCFCTERRLNLLRKEALKMQEIPKYDNKCRDLLKEEVEARIKKGEPHCIRFKISNKEESFNDLIYGDISYNVSLNEGDPVIIKSDGYPTYHYANVIDDHLMKITHVLRGVEWQISTTKHLMLYRAFGWDPPSFGHLPLLMNADGSKLSKRQGDIRISSYRENGIFPLALINYIANSGGGFEKDQERYIKPKCYTLEQLASQFDMSKINSHSGKLMSEMLPEFNRLELKRQFEEKHLRSKLVLNVKELLKNTYPERVENGSLQYSDEYITRILEWSLHRIDKLSDLFSKNLEFIWALPTSYSLDENVYITLKLLKDELSSIKDFNREELNTTLKHISKKHNIKYGKFMKDLRLVLSGLNEGPSVAEIISILGKDDTFRRIDLCLNKTNKIR